MQIPLDLKTFHTKDYLKGPFKNHVDNQGGGGVSEKTTKNHIGGRGGQAENHVVFLPKLIS